MNKLLFSMIVVAIVLSGFGAYKAYQYYQPKNELLALNLEALASDESGEFMKGEYYQSGVSGTNWKVYTVRCTGNATQVFQHKDSYEWKFDAISGTYNAVFKGSGSASGSSESSTTINYDSITWYKDVCGKGVGLCYANAPTGHPCV